MESLKLTEKARKVLEARYLRRDQEGRVIETPEQLFRTVSNGVAYAEHLLKNGKQAAHWEDIYHSLLTSLDFLPNSRTFN